MKKRRVFLIAFASMLLALCCACASTRNFQVDSGERGYAISATLPDFAKWTKEEVPFYVGENFEAVCWVYANPANEDENVFMLIGKEKMRDQWRSFIIAFIHIPSFEAWKKDHSTGSYYNDDRYIDEGVPSFSFVAVKKPVSPERFKKLVNIKEAKKPDI